MAATCHSALVAIACGGTGGHLFPGLAVAEALRVRGVGVVLFVSCKAVDREAVRGLSGFRVVALEAVGLDWLRPWRFVRGLVSAWRTVTACYREQPPFAVLGMGGFTSVAPILAGRRLGARTYLHESNTIPGRANGRLARFVDGVFVGSPEAVQEMSGRRVVVTGTPVRSSLGLRDRGACRRALGLAEDAPTMLVMGGSQGAAGVNRLALASLADLAAQLPDLQVIHLAGLAGESGVRAAYEACSIRAVVHGFLREMELVLGAADVAVSRAGAACLAELAAVQLPAVLVPYPAAVDNHQWHNAQALVGVGGALLLEERNGTGEALAGMVAGLLRDPGRRAAMREALASRHQPDAANRIAAAIVSGVEGVGLQQGLKPGCSRGAVGFGEVSRWAPAVGATEGAW